MSTKKKKKKSKASKKRRQEVPFADRVIDVLEERKFHEDSSIATH